MVRTKFPGGRLTRDQYLACDHLACEYGNNTLRITTRQDFQFHGVVKSNLRQTIKALNEALITTIAACGDVERNVMAPPTPATSPLVDADAGAGREDCRMRSAPETRAYHKIWVEGQELDLNERREGFVDPLYGKTLSAAQIQDGICDSAAERHRYFHQRPRLRCHCGERESCSATICSSAAGMGMSHGNAQTFPRMADVIGFLPPGTAGSSAKAVLTIHRDFGDRTNRKHARLKYVLEERGVDWFRAEVEQRAGIQAWSRRGRSNLPSQGDLLGWHQQTNGNYFLGLFVENGRIKDADGYQLKTGVARGG